MPVKKTLRERVLDRTFLARRHAYLLVADELVRDSALRTLQASYRTEESELERHAIALRFEKAVQSRAEEPTLTMRQALCASIGAGAPDQAAWEAWDRDHGFDWRVTHRAMDQEDEIEAFARLRARPPAGTRDDLYAQAKQLGISGRSTMRRTELIEAIAGAHKTNRREENLSRIRRAVPDLAERARKELELDPEVPDPPGFLDI
jgi:Rho termination factor, N-terminal domain